MGTVIHFPSSRDPDHVEPVVDRLDREAAEDSQLIRRRVAYNDAHNAILSKVPLGLGMVAILGGQPEFTYSAYGTAFLQYLHETLFIPFKSKAQMEILSPEGRSPFAPMQPVGLETLFQSPPLQQDSSFVQYTFNSEDFTQEQRHQLFDDISKLYEVFSWPMDPHSTYASSFEEYEAIHLLTLIGLKLLDKEIGNRSRVVGEVVGIYDKEKDINHELLPPGLIVATDGRPFNLCPKNMNLYKVPLGSEVTYFCHHDRDPLMHPYEIYDGSILHVETPEKE